MSSEQREVADVYGVLTYTLNRKQVKNINLRVNQYGEVSVSANRAVPVRRIDEFVASKADFIRKNQQKFEEAMENTNFSGGDSVMLIGQVRVISLLQSNEENVLLSDDKLMVSLNDIDDSEKIDELIADFTGQLASRTFDRIAKEVYAEFEKRDVPFPQIRIRELKSKWGSCNPRLGKITLNKYLIQAPIWCIEYVIAHEFCHLIVPNHSKDFYNLLTEVMPDGIERNREMKKLEKSGVLRTKN